MRSGRLLLTAGLAIYAIAALANGLDRVSAVDPGVERVVPWPFRAQADRSVAASDLTLQRTAAALPHAAAAVSHDPVDPDSAALLGSARLAAGNEQGAADAFRVAARFGWRNVATQLYWYQAALQVGDYRVTADRADAILRAHPSFAERETLLLPLETNVAARKFLVQHLATKPRWLEPYLQLLREDGEATVDRRISVLTELGSSGFPIGCDEVSQFAAGLMDRDRRTDAERVWNANCPTHTISGLLADPGFRQVDSQPPFPFGWRPMRSGEVEIANLTQGEGGLSIRSSAPSTCLVLTQPVSLPAGDYRLLLKVQDDAHAASGRLRFSFACDSSLAFPSSSGGDPLAGGQVIRVNECKRQQLGLWLSSGSAPVSLNSVKIERIK